MLAARPRLHAKETLSRWWRFNLKQRHLSTWLDDTATTAHGGHWFPGLFTVANSRSAEVWRRPKHQARRPAGFERGELTCGHSYALVLLPLLGNIFGQGVVGVGRAQERLDTAFAIAQYRQPFRAPYHHVIRTKSILYEGC